MNPTLSPAPSSPRLKRILILLPVLGLAGLVWLASHRATSPQLPVAPGMVEAGGDQLLRSELELRDGRLHRLGSPQAFTGTMVERFPDGALLSRSAVSNGLLHGLSEGWHTNAQLQVSEHFKEGVSHGLRTKWYPSGAKHSEASIVDGKLNGTFRRWHENGTLSEQVEFVAGRPEGTSVSYFPSGCLKARVVLKDAKPIQHEFWKDGEKKG